MTSTIDENGTRIVNYTTDELDELAIYIKLEGDVARGLFAFLKEQFEQYTIEEVLIDWMPIAERAAQLHQ